MLKCPICQQQTKKGEATGKFTTKIKVEYPNNVFGNRIVREIKCCMKCSGERYLEGSEKTLERIEEEELLLKENELKQMGELQ